jgi:hypothetical protein
MKTSILFRKIITIKITNLFPTRYKWTNAATVKLFFQKRENNSIPFPVPLGFEIFGSACDCPAIRKGDNQMSRWLGNMHGGIKFPNQDNGVVPGHSCRVRPRTVLKEDDSFPINKLRLFVEQMQPAQVQSNGFIAHIKSFSKLRAYGDLNPIQRRP